MSTDPCRAARLDEFASLLEQAVDEFADPACFAAALATDGPLAPDEIGALGDRMDLELPRMVESWRIRFAQLEDEPLDASVAA